MGRSAWQKHKQKHSEVMVTECHYCTHPPVESTPTLVKAGVRGVRYTRAGWKAIAEMYRRMVEKAIDRPLIQPASDKDIQLITGGQ